MARPLWLTAPEPFPGTPEALKQETERKHYWFLKAENLAYDLAATRRARNLMATLALVGWVLALAALGGAV